MDTIERTATTINLDASCMNLECVTMAQSLHAQLSNGYTRGASTMELPNDFNDYLHEHRTARKRAARAQRLGYRWTTIDRSLYEADIFEINTSKPERQGRPMTAAYMSPHRFSANPMLCERHHVYTYAVIIHGNVVAYLWLYRSGDLAMVSSILGHADHLTNDVMYLLVVETIRDQMRLGGTMFYNLHSSGTDGLRWFKERLGFQPTEIAWLL